MFRSSVAGELQDPVVFCFGWCILLLSDSSHVALTVLFHNGETGSRCQNLRTRRSGLRLRGPRNHARENAFASLNPLIQRVRTGNSDHEKCMSSSPNAIYCIIYHSRQILDCIHRTLEKSLVLLLCVAIQRLRGGFGAFQTFPHCQPLRRLVVW